MDRRFLKAFNYLAKKNMLTWMPDEMYIKMMFMYRFGYKLDLNNPQSFNEKIQWLKLYDHRQVYCKMVDKYEAKQYVSSIIGNKYIIPTIGVWNSFEQIDFSYFPTQFVLKCTHDSGSIVLCSDISKFDCAKAQKIFRKGLGRNMYYWGREWPYKSVKGRIIAEKYLRDESGYDLKDYKVLCFNGVPKLIELHQNRYTSHQSQDYYDIEWHLTNITQNGTQMYRSSKKKIDKPKTLDQMLELSAILSKGFPLLRVDWYSIDDQLYFGELTLYDGAGFEPYDDYKDDMLLGSWINLSELQKEKKGVRND